MSRIKCLKLSQWKWQHCTAAVDIFEYRLDYCLGRYIVWFGLFVDLFDPFIHLSAFLLKIDESIKMLKKNNTNENIGNIVKKIQNSRHK